MAGFEETLRNKNQTIADLQNTISVLDTEFKKLEQHHLEQQAANELKITKLQESVFRNVVPTRWQPMDDAAVTHELAMLQSSVTRFAKTFAVEGGRAPETWSSNRLVELAGLLRESDVAGFTTHQAMLDVLELRYGPRLCLSGLLSSAVHRAVFVNPFFFLVNPDEEFYPSDMFFDIYKQARNRKRSREAYESDDMLTVIETIGKMPICGVLTH